MVFAGDIGLWVDKYWFPLTHKIWDAITQFLFSIALQENVKNYLTAIAFFSIPFFVSFRARAKQIELKPAYKLLAFICSLFMIFLLAKHTFSDLGSFFGTFVWEFLKGYWEAVKALYWGVLVSFSTGFALLVGAIILIKLCFSGPLSISQRLFDNDFYVLLFARITRIFLFFVPFWFFFSMDHGRHVNARKFLGSNY